MKIFFLIFLLSGFLSVSAQTSPCKCADAKDMLYRIKEANAAIKEYQRRIQQYDAQAEITGNPVMYSLAEYRQSLQPAVQAAVNVVRANEPPPPPKSTRAVTDLHSCDTTVTGGSPCLQEAIKRHESFHSNTCKTKKPSPLNPASGYRDLMKMIEVAEEEITAYTLEKAYLSGELAKLPTDCKPPVWYLNYEVTVSGEGGRIQSTTGTKNQVKWKILHRYSGDIEFNIPIPQLPFTSEQQLLMSPAQIMAAMKKYPKDSIVLWKHKPNILLLFLPMDVFVKDEITTFSYEPGEGDSFEQTTTTEAWNGNYTDGAINEFTFFANFPDKLYNITIPIKPASQAVTKISPQIKKVKKEVIDRTKYGYGGEPTHEEPPPTITNVSFDSFEIPTIQGLLEKTSIHHRVNLPLNLIEDTLTFDSGDLKPTLPYLKGLPDAEKNIKVRVYYRLSKLPM